MTRTIKRVTTTVVEEYIDNVDLAALEQHDAVEVEPQHAVPDSPNRAETKIELGTDHTEANSVSTSMPKNTDKQNTMTAC